MPILRYELKHGDMLTFGILECQYLVGGDVDMVSKIYYVRYLVDSLSDGYLAAVRLNYTFAEVRKNIKMYDASDLKINTAGPEKRLLLHRGTENFLGLQLRYSPSSYNF